MRALNLIVVTSLVSAAACSSGASKEESLQIFAAASTAMASAQSRAVTDAQQLQALRAPAELVLAFNGPCALGGTVGVTGSYDASGSGDRTAFDMTASFSTCREAQGTIDGKLRWTSVVSGTSFSATMDGELDWSNSNGDSASCDFDLSMSVTTDTVAYSGHICGYDVKADLGITVGN
ncbi:MAG TPA: hypothetical protein VNO30_24605 [Kofleriaceae bacterium]|nr:hypothetical protein [Kofleriaceae bacterium]